MAGRRHAEGRRDNDMEYCKEIEGGCIAQTLLGPSSRDATNGTGHRLPLPKGMTWVAYTSDCVDGTLYTFGYVVSPGNYKQR